MIPTVTGLGLLSLALAAVPRGRAEDRPAALQLPWFRDRERLVARFGLAALLAGAAISVVFLYLGDLYVRKAREEQGRSASAQLSAAKSAAKRGVAHLGRIRPPAVWNRPFPPPGRTRAFPGYRGEG